MKQPDLFEARSPDDWNRDPMRAFETWLTQEEGQGRSDRFRESSSRVYRALWGSFVGYVSERHLQLSEVTAQDVSRFLGGLDRQNKNQRERSRKLIERVITAMHRETGRTRGQNAAYEALKESGAAWKQVDGNLPTLFLTPAERHRILDYLLRSALTASHDDWRSVRDRAMVGMFLGAGLKVAEALRLLTVNCVAVEEPARELRLRVTRPVDGKERELVLTGAARTLFAHWLAVRAARLGARGREVRGVVFASDLDGDPVAASRAMHPVTALRATDAVINACGIALGKEVRRGEKPADVERLVARASPQTLRNSYAASRFEAGQDAESVSAALGVLLISTQRLYASWQTWQHGLGDSGADAATEVEVEVEVDLVETLRGENYEMEV